MQVSKADAQWVHVWMRFIQLYRYVIYISPFQTHKVTLVIFRYLINGVFRNFDDQILITNHDLAAQPRVWLKHPGLVEQVIFKLIRRRQRIQTLPDDNMTSGAGTRHFAGVLNVDAMSHDHFDQVGTWFNLQHGALWASFSIR
jgi:hypothetical protein